MPQLALLMWLLVALLALVVIAAAAALAAYGSAVVVALYLEARDDHRRRIRASRRRRALNRAVRSGEAAVLREVRELRAARSCPAPGGVHGPRLRLSVVDDRQGRE